MCKYKIYKRQTVDSIIYQSNLKDEMIIQKDTEIKQLKSFLNTNDDQHKETITRLQDILRERSDLHSSLLNTSQMLLDEINDLKKVNADLNIMLAATQDQLAKYIRPRNSKGHFISTKK